LSSLSAETKDTAMRTLLFLLTICVAGVPSCAPSAPAPGTAPVAPEYAVQVTTGEYQGIGVDWAVLPDGSWPPEGRRQKTPFQLTLPRGRTVAVFRPVPAGMQLEVTLLRREGGGAWRRLFTSASLPVAVAIIEPGTGTPTVVGPSPQSLGVAP
jgi:hypothetical protein